MSTPDSWDPCLVCHGAGVVGDEGGDTDCFRCEGHGEVWRRDPEDHLEDDDSEREDDGQLFERDQNRMDGR